MNPLRESVRVRNSAPPRFLVRILNLVTILALAVCAAQAARWEAVDPEVLRMTDSAVKPGIDMEILQSHHMIEEEVGVVGDDDVITSRFVRAKIYTQKGVDDQGKLSIDCDTDERVDQLQGRVVKPDGTSLELKKSDIFETAIARRPWEKARRYSFVFPDLAPGDVVEYRWQVRKTGGRWGHWFYCQERVPVHEYKFTVGSLANKGRVMWFNCPEVERRSGSDLVLTMHDLPAFEPEDYMPGQREYRAWILIGRSFTAYDEEDLWETMSRYWRDEFMAASKPGAALKKQVAQLLAGAKTDEEKLLRLAEFCRSEDEVMNVYWRTSAAKQAEIEKLHKDEGYQYANRTFERRIGRPADINALFAAMARAAGYEVRLARTADRGEMLKVNTGRGWSFLEHQSVLVKTGDRWRFFDPGAFFTPADMLPAGHEGAVALVCDERKIQFQTVPQSAAGRSRLARTGRFELDAEGTLEGEVEIVLTGHAAAERKRRHWGESDTDDARILQEEVAGRLPNAEVSEVTFTNLHNNVHPVTVKYHLRVPGYAEQAGSRLVLTPAVFCVGRPAVLVGAERKYPILFDHAREEHDDIEIVLPEGYTLDKPSAPVPAGKLEAVVGSTYQLQYKPKTRTFAYRRDFALGANGALTFLPESYGALKASLEAVHASDLHSIMLKPKAAQTAAAEPTPSQS